MLVTYSILMGVCRTYLIMQAFACNDQGLCNFKLSQELRQSRLDTPGAIVDTPQGIRPSVPPLEIRRSVIIDIHRRHRYMLFRGLTSSSKFRLQPSQACSREIEETKEL